MSNNSKNWAYIVLAFVAGFGVNHIMPDASHGGKSQQCDQTTARNRAGWSRATQARKGKVQDRSKSNHEGRRARSFKPSEVETLKRWRGKGENGPRK